MLFPGHLTSAEEVRPGVYKLLFPESTNAVVPLRRGTKWQISAFRHRLWNAPHIWFYFIQSLCVHSLLCTSVVDTLDFVVALMLWCLYRRRWSLDGYQSLCSFCCIQAFLGEIWYLQSSHTVQEQYWTFYRTKVQMTVVCLTLWQYATFETWCYAHTCKLLMIIHDIFHKI